MRSPDPFVTIIVPVYNEEDAVGPFVEAMAPVLAGYAASFQILFVDDGSNDRTVERIAQLGSETLAVRLLRLSRNFGKEAALSAGIDHAQGDALIPMDVDLQDPPELIGEFLGYWRAGYDVVYGVRIDRSLDSFAKRQSAARFYDLFNRLSSVKIPANAGDYRLIDQRVANVIRNLPERSRFMKGLFAWVGFRSIGIPYQRGQRVAGGSKFNHWRLWNLALDGIIGFSILPLRVWTYLGGAIATLAFVYGSFIVVKTLYYGIDLPGYASLLATILFLGGVQLLSIGIIGEYIGRIFTEVKRRPLYIVDEGEGEPRVPGSGDMR